MISSITVNGKTVTLVAMPALGLRSVEFNMSDAVALFASPFTGQGGQAQQWFGADMWSGVLTLPPLVQADADQWISFLAQCRGMANAFQVGDPLKKMPAGKLQGSVPLIDNSTTGSNGAGAQTVNLKGFKVSKYRLLLPGDYLQIGYRFHRVLDPVNSDASGKASVNIWPSLREVPTDSSSVVLSGTRGLFRLANNKRTWSADVTRLTKITIPIVEYR